MSDLTLDFSLTNADRRTTVLLKNYWDGCKENKSFPGEKDIKPEEIQNIWPNCFIVEANNSSKVEDYKYIFLGDNIIKAYGEDLTGLKMRSFISPQAEHLAEEYERVLAFKQPIIDEGEFENHQGITVKYRQILLPLGDDGVNITSIIGAMTYKIFS